MAITLSHLAVKVTSKKNNTDSIVQDSRFFFQSPSYISNNFALLKELTTSYSDSYYYADLTYIPISLADFITNGVSAKISYKNLVGSTVNPDWNNPTYWNIYFTGAPFAMLRFSNFASLTNTLNVQYTGPGSPPSFVNISVHSHTEGNFAFQVVGLPGDPPVHQGNVTVDNGIGTITTTSLYSSTGPYVGVADSTTTTLTVSLSGGVGSTTITCSSTNTPDHATGTTVSQALTGTLVSFGGGGGGFTGSDTVDLDVISGTLYYWDNDIYKNINLVVNTVVQESATVNWNNLNNAKVLDSTASRTDSFGTAETKLLKVTWNLVTLNDLTGNPGTDPSVSSAKFTGLDYLPRWLEGYYTNTKINDFYTGCLSDTKYMSQYLTNNSFNPSFFKNKNNNYRKFYTTAFYTDIQTISVFAPSLSQPGPIYHLDDRAKGVYAVNKPYYIKTQGNYLEFYNLHFVKFSCSCVNNQIDLTTQFAVHEPLFDTSFYIMNNLGDFIVVSYEDLNQSNNKIPFSITGTFWVIYESKTILNSLIDQTAQVLINGYPATVAYKMENPFYQELSARFSYHSKYFKGDYDYQKHFQCFAFSNNWKSALASDLNLTSPIVWNTNTSFNLLSNNFVETDLDEKNWEFVTENLSRVNNDFFASNPLPNLVEVYYSSNPLTSNEYTVSGNKITLVNSQKPYNNLLVRYRKNKISTTFSGNKVSTVTYTGDHKTVYGIGLAKISITNKTKKYQKTSWTLNPTTFNSEFK